jgi:ribosomal protein S18 acetylase RimI-like enzyme
MRIEVMQPQHIAGAAEVHLDAFRGYPNARLGRGYARAFLDWFRRYDRGIALVAIDDRGAVAGYVAGAFIPYGHEMNRELFPLVARITIMKPWILLNRRFLNAVRAKLRWVIGRGKGAAPSKSIPPGLMSLVVIGTAKESRGLGVGAELVAAFEEHARRLGARTVRLSVYPENTSARRLYERCGWVAGADPRPGAAIDYTKILTA